MSSIRRTTHPAKPATATRTFSVTGCMAGVLAYSASLRASRAESRDAGRVGRGGAAAPGVRHAGERQSHLDAAQRAGQRQIVQVAQMPDPEHAALDLAEAGAERPLETVEAD